MCIKRFFHWKIWKKITEKYNSYQRNVQLIHILPVSAKLVYAFVQIACEKTKLCGALTHRHTDRQMRWKMISDLVVVPQAPYVFSSPLPWVSRLQSKGSLLFPPVRLPVSAYRLSRHPHQTLPSLGCSSLPPCPALQGPSYPQWPTLLAHVAAQGLASGANCTFILSVFNEVCIGPC